MENVTVDRDVLAEILKKNMKVHISDYENAYRAYVNVSMEELGSAMGRLSKGEKVSMAEVASKLTPPVSHEDSYKIAIRMLELSTSKEVTITEREFTQYVMDEWNWSTSFKHLNSVYSSSVRLS
jgi:hypothetical protein